MIVGIRPENFEDAALVSSENRHNGITFPATIDVIESLGSEKFVYFSKEIGGVETAELAELARDSGRADTGASAETVVARLDPATQLPEGQNAELWVDVRAIHVFDPANGRNLTLEESSAPASPAAPGRRSCVTPADADGYRTRRPTRPPGRAPTRPTGTGTDTAAWRHRRRSDLDRARDSASHATAVSGTSAAVPR